MASVQVSVTDKGFVVVQLTFEDGDSRTIALYPGEVHAIVAQLIQAAAQASSIGQGAPIILPPDLDKRPTD